MKGKDRSDERGLFKVTKCGGVRFLKVGWGGGVNSSDPRKESGTKHRANLGETPVNNNILYCKINYIIVGGRGRWY